MKQILAAVLLAVSLLTSGETVPQKDYYDSGITVRLLENETILELTLHDYLIDVVLQEMPASFSLEALKAQAVAARTYTMRRIYFGSAHGDADVCGDSTCCQCYLDEAEGRTVYGDGYAEARDKVRQAVEETDGMVLVYGEELIEAAYFSSTGGSTEAAAAVWGGDVPYLQPVSSPEEIRLTEQTVTPEQFRAALPEANLSGEPASWFGGVTYTEGGAVESMTIGGEVYTGAALRSRFALKSTRFTTAVTADGIVFVVTGAGHGVGMSQYGADAMAEAGSSFRQILEHYYTGAEVRQLY